MNTLHIIRHLDRVKTSKYRKKKKRKQSEYNREEKNKRKGCDSSLIFPFKIPVTTSCFCIQLKLTFRFYFNHFSFMLEVYCRKLWMKVFKWFFLHYLAYEVEYMNYCYLLWNCVTEYWYICTLIHSHTTSNTHQPLLHSKSTEKRRGCGLATDQVVPPQLKCPLG